MVRLERRKKITFVECNKCITFEAEQILLLNGFMKKATNIFLPFPTIEDMFVGEYGAKGTASRDEFDAKSRAWYYAEVLKNARKAAGITQQQLANVRLYPVRYA